MTEFQPRFVDRIVVDAIGSDTFVGSLHTGSPGRAFGGQIMAQCLVAASHTVEDPAREVHSLHGYFVRPALPTEPIEYRVERTRDGSAQSTRLVRATQSGETVFMLATSFAVVEDGFAHQRKMPNAPAPDSIPPPEIFSMSVGGDARYADWSIIDVRVPGLGSDLEMRDGRYERVGWLRLREDIGEHWLTQACALVYISDVTPVLMVHAPHSSTARWRQLLASSIDHAMWFHGPVRADQWTLFAFETPAARGGRGLAHATVFAETGVVVATVAQEDLIRRRQS